MPETPLLEEHVRRGAALAEFFGVQLPASFGDANAEYRATRDAVALADTNFHAAFSFSGPDRQRYVNAVLSSNVRDLQPGLGAIGLLLTPQGHILAEVETYLSPDAVLAISHAMERERTFTTFDKFIIMDDVKLQDITDTIARLSLAGPRSAAVISKLFSAEAAGLPEFGHAAITVESIPCRVVRRDRFGLPGFDLLAARDRLSALWSILEREVRLQEGAPVGLEALNNIRLEHGLPWFGCDFDDQQIPHEAALEHSHINYEKGCYTGQEIVERVRSRGHVNRRLAMLRFSATPPAPKTKLFAAGAGDAPEAEAGYVTSTGFSPMLGSAIGLGYVRREYSASGTRLDAAGRVAEVIAAPSQAKAHA